MNARITLIFYIALGLLGLIVVWAVDSAQSQPAPAPVEVKQTTIELKPEDFDIESPQLQEAVEKLSQPVQKPTSSGSSSQLQPAAQNSDAHQLPQ